MTTLRGRLRLFGRSEPAAPAGLDATGRRPPVLTFSPPRWVGVMTGLFGLLTALVVLAAIFLPAIGAPISGQLFLRLLFGLLVAAVAGNFLLLTYGVLSLRYRVTGDTLQIRWAHITHHIPLARVQAIRSGAEASQLARGIRGVHWPGYHIGRCDDPERGVVLCYSTHLLPHDLVVVETPGLYYLISPADPDAFIEAVATRRAGARLTTAPITFQEWRFINSSFWRDRPAQIVVLLAMAMNAALIGYLLISYPRLPPLIPLHWNIFGVVDRIGFTNEIFSLPAIAAIVLVTNFIAGVLLHRREKLAAYLLFGAAFWVQVLFLFAAIRIAGF
jgi:hypothetical protein